MNVQARSIIPNIEKSFFIGISCSLRILFYFRSLFLSRTRAAGPCGISGVIKGLAPLSDTIGLSPVQVLNAVPGSLFLVAVELAPSALYLDFRDSCPLGALLVPLGLRHPRPPEGGVPSKSESGRLTLRKISTYFCVMQPMDC